MLKKLKSTLFILAITINVHAQDSSNTKVRYEKGFEFNKGIFLSLEDFKNNSPINASRIISEHDSEERDFYWKVIRERKLTYLKEKGDTATIASHNTWGYSEGLNVYFNTKQAVKIKVGVNKPVIDKYPPARLNIIGRICAFQFVGRNDDGSYNNIYDYIIEVSTGKLTNLTLVNFKNKFKHEKELFDEFLKQKGKPKHRMYGFIMKYNEKYPIYFPGTKQ